MTDAELATQQVMRIAGRRGFRDRVRPGLTEHQIGEICGRLADARERSGLSVPRFLALRGSALRQFCAAHGIDRAEARLAQELARAMWRAAQLCRLGAFIASSRKRGMRPHGRMQ